MNQGEANRFDAAVSQILVLGVRAMRIHRSIQPDGQRRIRLHVSGDVGTLDGIQVRDLGVAIGKRVDPVGGPLPHNTRHTFVALAASCTGITRCSRKASGTSDTCRRATFPALGSTDACRAGIASVALCARGTNQRSTLGTRGTRGTLLAGCASCALRASITKRTHTLLAGFTHRTARASGTHCTSRAHRTALNFTWSAGGTRGTRGTCGTHGTVRTACADQGNTWSALSTRGTLGTRGTGGTIRTARAHNAIRIVYRRVVRRRSSGLRSATGEQNRGYRDGDELIFHGFFVLKVNGERCFDVRWLFACCCVASPVTIESLAGPTVLDMASSLYGV